MYYKYLIIILLVFLVVFSVEARDKKKKKKKKEVPENIDVIESKFSLAPIYVNEFSYLLIKNRNLEQAGQMKYKPNIIGSVGAKMTIKNFTISYVHALPQPEEFGKTKAKNFVFNYQRRLFGVQFYWTQYDGVYLDTLDRYGIFDDMYKKGLDNAYVLRPDIKINNIGFQMYFTTTKSFSINAAFEQTERQKKTAGSFLMLVGANYMSVSNDKGKSLILSSQEKYFPKTKDLYSLGTVSIKVAPGIGYSFIFKKYYSLSTILDGGLNFQFKWYDLDISNRTHFSPWASFYYQARLALGYNGERFFANLVYSNSQDIIGFRDSDKPHDCSANFKFYREFFKVTAGFRIL